MYLLKITSLGFLSATLAAFLDHARLGFVPVYTIIPLATMWLNLLAGLIWFGLHVAGDLSGTQSLVVARFMYRDPLLGPLHCNLAMLGVLSLLPESLEAGSFIPWRNSAVL